MSRNMPLTSRPSSSEFKISDVIDINWLMQESPRLKPDRFCEIKLSSI